MNNKHTSNNSFSWQFGDGPIQEAKGSGLTFFTLTPSDQRAVVVGRIGNVEDINLFSFAALIPFTGQDPIEATLTVGDDNLRLIHSRSTYRPAGGYEIEQLNAEKGTITFKLDPIERTIEGTFEAHFLKAKLSPKCTFKVSSRP